MYNLLVATGSSISSAMNEIESPNAEVNMAALMMLGISHARGCFNNPEGLPRSLPIGPILVVEEAESFLTGVCGKLIILV